MSRRRLAISSLQDELRIHAGESEPAEGIDRPASDAVRKTSKEKDCKELDRCPDQQGIQRQAPRLLSNVDEIGQRKNSEDIIGNILPDAKPGTEQKRSWSFPQDLQCRKSCRRPRSLYSLFEEAAF